MSGTAVISSNTAIYSGGGVYAGGSFTKSGGTVYGSLQEGGTMPEDPLLKNTAGSGNGHAAYVSSTRYRNTTAGPGVDLDSNTGTNWGL
jgi:predicted outer membrane repeat protein